jgi:hypothetical protein
MAKADKGMGRDTAQGHQNPSRTETTITDESDLGSDMAGNNRLQGNDQENVQNQRKTWPEESAGAKRARTETR